MNAEWRQAILTATQHTKQIHGLTDASAMQLLPNAQGQIAADSGIAHLQNDANGVQRVVAVTSSEAITAAWRALRSVARNAEGIEHDNSITMPSHSDEIVARGTQHQAPAPSSEPIIVTRGKPAQHASAPENASLAPTRAGFPPDHRDAALREAIQDLLPPQTSEDRLTQLTVAARTAGIRAESFKGITVNANDPMVLHLHGFTPGFMATVDLKQSVPSQTQSLQRLDGYYEQHAERQAIFQAQQERANAFERIHGPGPGGPGLSLGM